MSIEITPPNQTQEDTLLKLTDEELKVAEDIMLTEEPYLEGWLLFNEYI